MLPRQRQKGQAFRNPQDSSNRLTSTYSGDGDHRFLAKPIADSDDVDRGFRRCRSRIPLEADHLPERSDNGHQQTELPIKILHLAVLHRIPPRLLDRVFGLDDGQLGGDGGVGVEAEVVVEEGQGV
mgnify:CR=1 FL=1